MFNKNINGNVNLSVKLANITSESGIEENAFGIKVRDLYNLAKSVYTVPVLRIVDAVNGSIVEYTLIEHKKTTNGYNFTFVGKDFLTLVFTNATRKYTATITPIGSDTGLEIALGNLSTGQYVGDAFRALPCYDAIMELIETENPEVAYTTIEGVTGKRIGRIGSYVKTESNHTLRTYFLQGTSTGLGRITLTVSNYNNPETIALLFSETNKAVFDLGMCEAYNIGRLTFPEIYTHADFESLDMMTKQAIQSLGAFAQRIANSATLRAVQDTVTVYINKKAYVLSSGDYNATTDTATIKFVNIFDGMITEIALIISNPTRYEAIAFETTIAETRYTDESVSVTADGVKTYGQLLNELLQAADVDKITPDSRIEIAGHWIYHLNLKNGAYIYECCDFILSSSSLIHFMIYADGANSSIASYVQTTSGLTVTEMTSDVPSSGNLFKFVY